MLTPSLKIDGLIHWHDGAQLVRSRGTCLEISYDSGFVFEPFFKVPQKLYKRCFSHTKLGCRLLRTNIKHCFPLRDNRWMVFCGKRIFVIDDGGNIHADSMVNGSRPLRVCKTRNSIFYGEYCPNSERKPIRLWQSRDNGLNWTVAFTFRNIRHVHGVFQDPKDGSIWVTTGDNDEEAAIYRAEDEHSLNFQPVLQGSQQTRVIDVLFGEDFIYFGSDAPHEKNWLYRCRRDGSDLDRLQQVEGTVFHARNQSGRFYFSTACEPSDVNKSSQVELWQSSADAGFQKVWSDEKDSWGMKYFQYGQILFPSGIGEENRFWISSFATRNDQKSFRFDVSAAIDSSN